MLFCNPLKINLLFEHQATGDEVCIGHEFEVSSSLESDVQNVIDEYLEEHENLAFVEREVIEHDTDFDDPDGFADLDEYGEYVEKCEEHGEAYVLRYKDIGDHEFDDEYCGCWDSAEEFIQDMIEQTVDIPDYLIHYIDWEKMTRDYMMDYSEYDGSEGTHIFRN